MAVFVLALFWLKKHVYYLQPNIFGVGLVFHKMKNMDLN